MQPVQSPEEYQVAWLQEKGLADPAALKEARQRLAAELNTRPLMAPRVPTLLSVLADMGRLTPAQRDEGEAETARRRGGFMNWRSETMAEEQRRRDARKNLPPGPTA